MLILPHHSPLGKLRPREIKVHNWLSAIRQAGDEVATCIFGSPVESTDVSEPRLHEAAVQANAPLLATQDIDAVMRRTCVGLAGSVTELLAGPSGHLATFELGNEIDGHVTGRCCAPADRFLTYVDVKCAVGVHFVTVMRRIADVIVIVSSC